MCVRTERCSDGKQTSVHLTNTGHRRRTTTTVLQMTIDQPAATSTAAWTGLARQRQVPIVIEIELNEEEMFYTFLLRESVLVCHIKMPSGIQAGRQAFGPARPRPVTGRAGPGDGIFFSIRTYFQSSSSSSCYGSGAG